MIRASIRHDPFPAKRGAALLIVLFFIVLLTGLLVAFLSRALTARVVANSSAGEAKVSVLASGAGDIIIGDLKQEIIDGSMASNEATGFTVYTPKGASSTNGLSTMTPAISGFTPVYSGGQETDGLANLIKVSKYGVPSYTSATNANYTTTGINRASQVNSYSNPSLNGRLIKPARWNSHYLIARATTGSSLDSTPVSAFPSPDWIIVTRGGANVAYSSYSSTLSDPTVSNTNYAVGRYAYAIYNEGGLLDMNAAGYPGTDATSGSVGLTAMQISKKGSLALADLMQLPVSSTNTVAVMTQAQINNLVGWRNYYTSQLTSANGSFGSIVFDAKSSQTNWINNFVTYNGTNAFMGANTNSLTNPAPPTDQALLSRQQLISLTQSLGISPDALQYLSTFSRGLEQPCYSPDPSRPTIINPATPPPPATGSTGNNVDSYLGNNDAAGADNVINPAFLNVRVTTKFANPRLDGTTAILGEPLVKKKFALSRLGLVTYQTTNTTQTPPVKPAATEPIYARFGIYRSSTSSAWVYDHGIVSSSGGGTIIGTLAQVAAAGREPDFAELLKAALTAGSLAKGGPGLAVNQGNYQYVVDTALDYQVLQIMANIIDQYDTDSYPTVIQITSGTGASTVTRTFYGVEDLPYFYRYHLFCVVDRLPSPLLSSSSSVSFPTNTGWVTTGSTSTAYQYPSGAVIGNSWTTTSNPYNVKINGAQAGTLADAGEATYYYIPDLWNPHDPNTLASSSANRPTAFRAVAETQDPTGTNSWQIGVEDIMTGSGNSNPSTNSGGVVTPGASSFKDYLPENNYPTPNPPSIYDWPISTPTTLTKDKTALNFSDNGGLLFREPTLLWNTNPTGINLSHPDTANTGWPGSAVEYNTSKTYYGIVAGKVPISTQVNYVSSPPQSTDGPYVFQGSSLNNLQSLPTGAYAQITFSLQYQDPTNSTNWITYDVKYPDLHGLSSPNIVAYKPDYPSGSWQSPVANSQMSDHASSFDPRSARWGVGTESLIGHNADHGSDYLLEPTAHKFYSTNTVSGYQSLGASNFSVFETQKPRADLCNFVNYSNPGMTSNPGKNKYMRWFSGTGYSASGGSGDNDSPNEYDGLLSQNLPSITLVAKLSSNPVANMYVEDADGMARPAMGAYAYAYQSTDALTTADTSQSSLATVSAHRTGMPMATASSYLLDNGTGTATTQSQSRPMVLNRAFRSVSDLSYTFRGTPWKNIDFFTPGSGDSALLDAFCVNEPPSNGIVAGKVDLNTRQMPVLKAVISGSVRDEIAVAATNAPSSFTLSPAGSTLSPLTSTEAGNAAAKLVAITTASDAWRGPLSTLGSLVGHFVASPGTTSVGSIGTDWYTYSPPVLSVATTPAMASSYTYAGLSGALDSTVYTASLPSGVQAASPYMIQRFREAALRPLIDVGQTRVWNLLIDVIAQTGRYPHSATGLDQFVVDGEKRLWIHVAIDRYTGQVIDKQVEVVTQ